MLFHTHFMEGHLKLPKFWKQKLHEAEREFLGWWAGGGGGGVIAKQTFHLA